MTLILLILIGALLEVVTSFNFINTNKSIIESCNNFSLFDFIIYVYFILLINLDVYHTLLIYIWS